LVKLSAKRRSDSLARESRGSITLDTSLCVALDLNHSHGVTEFL
jgi:hypothetical protein